MSNTNQNSRSQTEQLRWTLVGLALLVGIGVSMVSIVAGESFTGFLLNLGTEIIGAAILYVVLDIVLGQFESQESEARAAAERQDDLLDQLRSKVPAVAKRAVEQLRKTDAWFDGTLRGLRLEHSDLSGIEMNYASLREADMTEVNLQEAWLIRVDFKDSSFAQCNFKRAQLSRAFFRRSKLIGCNLSRAYCQRTDFRDCIMRHCDLSGATLHDADLRGSDLTGCTLHGAQFNDQTQFDDGTTLPDGTQWAPGVDLTLFTEGEA